MTIGVIREEKNPPDKRVPLTPKQCVTVQQRFNTKVIVQPSSIRAISDNEYKAEGIEVKEDLTACDILLGVKEVPVESLLNEKTYLFFSHTYKKQPYNRDLLKAILHKNIRLVDYEMLTGKNGARLIAFGKYAGIVGAYNALRGYGEVSKRYSLKPAHQCHDKEEMYSQFTKLNILSGYKIVVTGKGRVGGGALETLYAAGIKQVSPVDFLQKKFNEPVFTNLDVENYNQSVDGQDFSKEIFYEKPHLFKSAFHHYSAISNMYIACHYWDSKAPFIFTREDAKKPGFNIDFVADISCDIDGPVASTLRPSTIANPFYGYHPQEEAEVEFGAKGAINVMAVDNLPCELPRDASQYFGHDLIENVLPHLLEEDGDNVIWRATEAQGGELTQHFSYLRDYVNGTE